jgi:hypothetical protein
LPEWDVTIRRSGLCAPGLFPALNHSHTSQLERVVPFTGKVYCLTVPSHVFLVRRHGRCSFTGNSSRHGQKGTIGMIVDDADMPFAANGMRPDIIINPHCIPSRMTIAQLMETLMGHVCCRAGTLGDGSPFEGVTVERLGEVLRDEYGLEPHGDEILYSGQTGAQLQTAIFMGPCFYQRLKHMVNDKMHCLTPDHDVLTSAGWLPIGDVTTLHRVATLQSGRLVYASPTARHEFDHNGKMLHVANTLVDLCVTPEHRMWCAEQYGLAGEWRYDLRKATDVVGRVVRYQRDAAFEAPDYQFELPGRGAVDMRSWLTLVGIWTAEGCVSGSGLTLAANKPRVRGALIPALETLGFDYALHDGGLTLDVRDAAARDYFAPLSVDAPSKSLPAWVWQLSRRQAEDLVHAMMLGDGTFGATRWVYTTSSTRLADDVMRLTLHAGWSATKAAHTAATADATHWRLAIVRSENRPTFNHSHVGKRSAQTEEWIDYDGKVHCLSVPGEVFYVRRNGKPVWTGNSRSSGPVVLLTRQPAEGRSRDGGLRFGEMERDVMIAHGTTNFLKERMMECSDNFEVYVCRGCGLQGVVNPSRGKFVCTGCANTTDFAQVRTPYAFKLLSQELESMGIVTRLIPDSRLRGM